VVECWAEFLAYQARPECPVQLVQAAGPITWRKKTFAL